MTIDEISKIVSNRLQFLKAQRTQAVAAGELEQVTKLDAQIAETQETLNKLLTLE